jgi:hypothetical protein
MYHSIVGTAQTAEIESPGNIIAAGIKATAYARTIIAVAMQPPTNGAAPKRAAAYENY